ncbi:MAG: long-chain fatty acid transport protein [Candidatus Azotimanducaceae bacterium]|jgi:long-chain fatty acid transport protein
MRIRGRLTVVLALSATFIAQGSLATNGYFTHGLGVKNKGMAGAGNASPSETISVASNPAAAVMVGEKYEVGLSIFAPRRSYNASTSLANGNGGAFTLGSGQVDSGRKYFPIPYISKAWKLDDTSGMAINFYGRGGMNTTWGSGSATLDPDGGGPMGGPAPVTNLPGTFGGGDAGVNLSQAFLGLVYGRKMGDLNVGVSAVLAMQAFKATGLANFAGFTKTFAASGGTVFPSNLTNNGTDFSYGLGIQVGAIYSINEQLNVGASYQSETRMSEFDNYADLFAEGGGFDIPAALRLSASYSATPEVSLHFDYERTIYSKVDSVGNRIQNIFACPTAGQGGSDLESCLGGDNGAGFGWDDVDTYKFGVEWNASADIVLRAGYSTAKQPINDDQVLFNILAPAVVEQHFTIGATYKLNGDNELSVSLMYAPSESVTGANTFDPTQQLEIEMHQFELEIGYSF